MDESQMNDLLKPISDLAGNMSQFEVDDKTAEAVLAEVLEGQREGDGDDAARAEREARFAKTEARGKALEALRHAELAARLDAQLQQAETDERLRVAIKYYERSAHDFSLAIHGGAIKEEHLPKTASAMTAYLDRARSLRLKLKEPKFDTDNVDGERRRTIFTTLMSTINAPILARGVQARKLALEADQDWSRFVLFAESADCFMSYLKSIDQKKPSDLIMRALQDVLKELEALAPKLRHALAA